MVRWRGARFQGPDAPCLALLDWMMPGLDGLEVCRRVRAAGREPYVYIIILAHGHAAGDAVLRHAASTMRATVRPYDLLGRYGGEEFVIVLPGCDAAGARAAAERLRASMAGTAIAVGEVSLRVTCSLGVAVGSTEDGWDRDRLHDAAPADVRGMVRRGRVPR